jgi:hypothetical protein
LDEDSSTKTSGERVPCDLETLKVIAARTLEAVTGSIVIGVNTDPLEDSSILDLLAGAILREVRP